MNGQPPVGWCNAARQQSLVPFIQKRGSTPVQKLTGGIEPPPLHTQYRTKHKTTQTYTGQRNKLKDVGTTQNSQMEK